MKLERERDHGPGGFARSDHCPAMKGIETRGGDPLVKMELRSDHCPAMKGIETHVQRRRERPPLR